MAKTLSDLSISMKALAVAIPLEANRMAVEAAQAGLKYWIYEGTPVDTSQALSNWQASIGIGKKSFIPPYVPGFLGYTASASAAAAYDEAVVSLKVKQPGEVIHITNNAPYILALDAGSSKQAPAGLVDRGILIIRNAASKHKFKLA